MTAVPLDLGRRPPAGTATEPRTSRAITLVCMPWQAPVWPSLAMSVIDTLLTGHGHHVTQMYANLAFADHVLDRTGGELDPDDYAAVYRRGYRFGVGEWIFTSALYGPGWNQDAYLGFLRREGYAHVEEAARLHELAPGFVDELVTRIVSTDPDLVGFTTTFDQNVPALAAATALKRRRPDLPVVFGGANCDGAMGAAVARNFPAVDYVIRGDAERPLPMLLRALDGALPFTSVPGLCWRDRDGTVHENRYQPAVIPGDLIPSPDFRPYFDLIDTTASRPWLSPLFVRLETSRGCWWGEKSQCTFCGLNGGTMAYRAKSPERAWEEIASVVRDHHVLDIAFADNILDPAYVDTVLPRLTGTDWDLRLFYEVKSNLKPDEVAALARAGVSTVQPGIESLSTRVLKIMKKGASGPGQVRALRLFRENRIYPMWNILYGFPGESWERDYRGFVEQLPALVHLAPPSTTRIELQRFSPLYEQPELGVPLEGRRPDEWYRLVYDLPETELDDLAYLFSYPDRGIGADEAAILEAAIAHWSEAYRRSSLEYRLHEDGLTVHDRRYGRPAATWTLTGADAVTYLVLRRNLSVRGLAAVLAGTGTASDPAALTALLESWHAAGLVFRDGEEYVALATPADPGFVPDWAETAGADDEETG